MRISDCSSYLCSSDLLCPPAHALRASAGTDLGGACHPGSVRASTRYDGPVLEVRGIAKRFGPIRAVRGIDLNVEHGETYGLLGPNGPGKSTSISIIAGLLAPDAGNVEVAGQPMTKMSTSARAEIGLVPQEMAVYPEDRNSTSLNSSN